VISVALKRGLDSSLGKLSNITWLVTGVGTSRMLCMRNILVLSGYHSGMGAMGGLVVFVTVLEEFKFDGEYFNILGL